MEEGGKGVRVDGEKPAGRPLDVAIPGGPRAREPGVTVLGPHGQRAPVPGWAGTDTVCRRQGSRRPGAGLHRGLETGPGPLAGGGRVSGWASWTQQECVSLARGHGASLGLTMCGQRPSVAEVLTGPHRPALRGEGRQGSSNVTSKPGARDSAHKMGRRASRWRGAVTGPPRDGGHRPGGGGRGRRAGTTTTQVPQSRKDRGVDPPPGPQKKPALRPGSAPLRRPQLGPAGLRGLGLCWPRLGARAGLWQGHACGRAVAVGDARGLRRAAFRA